MRLLIIRHGDPDYEHDSLTPQGWREAELLSERLAKLDIRACYVSPLGRAKDTASFTLKKLGCTATECEWLREFFVPIDRPDVPDRKMIPWDWLPQDWLAGEEFYDRGKWMEHSVMQAAGVREEYTRVTKEFDALLASHGYERDGEYYRAVRPNRDILALFCHFGLECVLLSHLMHVSPMILWHQMCAAPSSVTTVYTEERRAGIANFRVSSFGDTSHLYAGGEEPSFAARFCETYDSEGERRD